MEEVPIVVVHIPLLKGDNVSLSFMVSGAHRPPKTPREAWQGLVTSIRESFQSEGLFLPALQQRDMVQFRVTRYKGEPCRVSHRKKPLAQFVWEVYWECREAAVQVYKETMTVLNDFVASFGEQKARLCREYQAILKDGGPHGHCMWFRAHKFQSKKGLHVTMEPLDAGWPVASLQTCSRVMRGIRERAAWPDFDADMTCVQGRWNRSLLVVDLDETLVHTKCGEAAFHIPEVPGKSYHFIVSRPETFHFGKYHVFLRPGWKEFLLAANAHFDEVLLWTAADPWYADAILHFMDPDHALLPYRCVRGHDGRKSLHHLRRNHVLLLDDKTAYRFQTHGKFLHVPPFVVWGEPKTPADIHDVGVLPWLAKHMARLHQAATSAFPVKRLQESLYTATT